MSIHMHPPAFAAFSGLLSTCEISHQAFEGYTTLDDNGTQAKT